ncbi:hypothetical protein [Actinoplanes siamensis]|uniref:Uncharacterized protein n=1 Tax=Actinoplanes siamensis TaxID=1223317 RepID=A0A919KDH3_9ACTN|nr:hypothetical protein [Actinoplanes siamensis]GIF02492.1 hypothetical protein Asi03nite_00300 [Actinoplanes siamensis]
MYESGLSGGWAPVEHRFFGLDRRTLRPAVFALVVGLVLIYGWQALDAAIPWHNRVRAGDVLDLGGGATAVPPVGWELQKGFLTGQPGASATDLHVVLASGGARITMTGSSFSGSAGAFLDQVRRSESDDRPPAVNGPRQTIVTGAGLAGVVESSSGPGGDAVVAAFKMAVGPARAVEAAPALLVRVRTAPGQLPQYQEAVAALLRSITVGASR